jgi:hypothetical protein
MICQYGEVFFGRVADVGEILLALTTVKEAMVSINAEWWDRPGQVPAGRVKGRISKLTSKSRGHEQLSMEWELGIGHDGYVPGEKYTEIIFLEVGHFGGRANPILLQDICRWMHSLLLENPNP